MTFVPPVMPYASPVVGTCPLCQTRPVIGKFIYNQAVCKKCYYKFANRRQLAYLVDGLIFNLPIAIALYVVTFALIKDKSNELVISIVGSVIGLITTLIFILKDGFSGQSPGKRLCNVQVLDNTTGQPISFGQSFKRNAILLVGSVPILGGYASLVIVIIIAVQVAKGYRLGDKFANTRVIWKKYAYTTVFGGSGQHCRGCGYSLVGNESGVCPECGLRAGMMPGGMIPAGMSPAGMVSAGTPPTGTPPTGMPPAGPMSGANPGAMNG